MMGTMDLLAKHLLAQDRPMSGNWLGLLVADLQTLKESRVALQSPPLLPALHERLLG